MDKDKKNIKYTISQHAIKRITERGIQKQWINTTLSTPDLLIDDPLNNKVRHALKRITEMDDRVLRVVYNDSVVPYNIISVFFDRRMKGKT